MNDPNDLNLSRDLLLIAGASAASAVGPAEGGRRIR